MRLITMNYHSFLFIIACLLQVSSSLIVQSPPRIIKQPPTDELLFQVKTRADESDKPFIIECEADGEPAPEYTWIKDGKPFDWRHYDDRITQQPGRGTLVIKSPRDEDVAGDYYDYRQIEGQYQCFARNKYGTAITNSVFVRKSELFNFKDEPPQTMDVEEGLPFGISCAAPNGWPKPNVQWMITAEKSLKTINSSRLTVDPEGKLWFSNVTLSDTSDDFLYACSAASYFRNEYKIGNRVHLNVIPRGSDSYNYGISNTHQPVLQYVNQRNDIAYRGKEFRLWCIVGGTPLPKIKWTRLGNIPLPKDRITYESYHKTLVIKHVDFEDAGEYQCEASNGVGRSKYHTTQIQVYAKPRFKTEPEIQLAAEGEEVVFVCEADGYPHPTIQWIHNGVPIEKHTQVPNRQISENQIRISNLKKSDTGNYGCNASNSLGYVYKDVYVNVLSLPPEILNPPAKQSRVVQGEPVTITCKTFGAPKPLIKWFHDGQELYGDRYDLMANGNLVIKRADFDDAGIYTCNATNKLGKDSSSGHLVIKERTKIVEPPTNYEAEAGSTATFRCRAHHDPSLPLRIRWFKDNQYLSVNSNNRFLQNSDHSLAITRLKEEDSGTYTCMAETDLDFDEAKAILIVQDVPNPPFLQWVTCRPTDADVVWRPSENNKAPITSFTIERSTSFAPDQWEKATDIVPPGDTSFKVSMSPWANYTFRVIATNKVGNSEPSESSDVCTTPANVPFKNPDNVLGRGTSPDNLVISWTAMKKIEHNAPGFHYKVYWKNENEERWNMKEIFNWETNQLVIEDQPTYQEYKIKVVAHNDVGEANVAANEEIGYSGEDVPTHAPKKFTLNQVVGPRSALVTWDSVPPASIRGEFKGYKIQTWTEESGEEKFREIISMQPDSTQQLLGSLKPNSRNFARVLAFNGAYNGPPSNIIEIVTPEGVPGSVDSLHCYPMGSSALLLEWKPPQEINGVLTGYRIYFQEVTGESELGLKEERSPQIGKDKEKAKLAGLKPHSKYRVTIKATTKPGEGHPYYTDCDTNPLATKPPSEPSFKHTIILPNDQCTKENDERKELRKIKITWQPNIKSGNPGSHFFVKYRGKDDERKQQLWTRLREEYNEDSFVVDNLEPDKYYEFQVVAVDGSFTTPSKIVDLDTFIPDCTKRQGSPGPGWTIGMIFALLFLVLVCVIVFLVKQNRGGKYSVQEREELHGRRDPYDDGGFPEFTQPLHDRQLWSAQTSSDLKLPQESDSDSINDYAGGTVAGRFDEDGSFIGQYGTLQRRQQEQLLQQQMQQQELGIKPGGTYV